jgi:hypothetical protein
MDSHSLPSFIEDAFGREDMSGTAAANAIERVGIDR